MKFTAGLTVKLLTLTFELNTIVPEFITTSVFGPGIIPQLQFAGFSQAVFAEPVHVFKVAVQLGIKSDSHKPLPYVPALSFMVL